MNRIDKEHWLNKWREKKNGSKTVEEGTLSHINKILRFLEIIGALVLSIGIYILLERIRDAFYMAFFLILSSGLLLGITLLIKGVLTRGVIFLKDIATTIVNWSIGILMIGGGLSAIPVSMSGDMTYVGVIAVVDLIIGFIIVTQATKGFDEAIRYNSKNELTLSLENVPYLYSLIVLLGFIVIPLSGWNIIVTYAGFFFIIGGSLAMLITVLLVGFLKMGASFLKNEKHFDTVILLTGLSMFMGSLLRIPDLNATVNPGYDVILCLALLLDLFIILLGNYLLELKYYRLTKEIDTEKERHKKFLAQLRAQRNGREEITIQDKHHPD